MSEKAVFVVFCLFSKILGREAFVAFVCVCEVEVTDGIHSRNDLYISEVGCTEHLFCMVFFYSNC